MYLSRQAKPILFLLAALFASVGPAMGDDLRTRFHDAYVQEVIDGKVAEAAVTYLALMEAEAAPLQLRAEARFRFAICAVLLGRADEGRAHLTALIRDKFVSEALRERSREYLKSVSGIGVGSELDRKLQALVFDLGRQQVHVYHPAAYRDFEIIGVRAIPFLRTLLGHSDANLRKHAFRLLCRLDAPGVAALWVPELYSFPDDDFILYLKRHPKERAALEKRILALGQPALLSAQSMTVGTKPFFSRAFILRAVAAGLRPGTAVAWLGLPLTNADFEQLAVWMRGPDAALADAATEWLLRHGADQPGVDEAFQEAVFARLLASEQDLRIGSKAETPVRLAALTERLPLASMLDRLERLIEDIASHGGKLETRPGSTLMLDPVAACIDGQRLAPAQAERYGGLLVRWQALASAGGPGPLYMTAMLAAHLRHALAGMPEERALAQVQRLFQVPGRSRSGLWNGVLLAATNPRQARLWATAIEAAPRGERQYLLAALGTPPGKAPAPALAEELDAARLAIMGVLTQAEVEAFFKGYDRVVAQRPASDVRRHVRAVLEKARTLGEKERKIVLQHVLTGNIEYVEKILVPLSETEWQWMDGSEKRLLLNTALRLRNVGYTDQLLRERARDAAAAILRPHLADLAAFGLFDTLFSLRDDLTRYPVHSWFHLLPSTWGKLGQRLRTQGTRILPVDADREAREMLRQPKVAWPRVLDFVASYCSPAFGAEILDEQLRSNDPQRRAAALAALPAWGAPAHAVAVEDMVEKELALDAPDDGRLRAASRILLRMRPSAKLFPVARVLLSSEDAHFVIDGIELAASLGQGDLLADLKPHLASMNSAVRLAAGKAVAAIQAIAALQVEAPAGSK